MMLKPGPSETLALITLNIDKDADAVFARQRARQIAEFCGLDVHDQTRFATAVSELARNIHQYAKKGKIFFALDLDSRPQSIIAEFQDHGPGIAHLASIQDGTYKSSTGMGVGLIGAQRLMDEFTIETASGQGTRIRAKKNLSDGFFLTRSSVPKLATKLLAATPSGASEEMRFQNHELILALDRMSTQSEQLAELNAELAETNRGVLALYAELDEKATSLQRANEVKTNFLSHMTHEFRTPLTSVISIAQILLQRLDGDLSSEQEKQVNYIVASARGLLELVNDLLDVAKVESGRISLHPKDIDLFQFVSALRGMFKPILGQNQNVSLVIEDPENKIRFVSDEAKVAQILRNLISNALKFTEQGEIRVSIQQIGSEIEFVVSDTGVGIALENRETIFEEFAQVDHAPLRFQRGTGLGLPLSRKLATLLGGRIVLNSELGKGSTFRVRLPLEFSGRSEGTLISGNVGRKECTDAEHICD